MGGQGVQLPSHILGDQLTLSQPEEPPIVLLVHPALGSFLRPCTLFSLCSPELSIYYQVPKEGLKILGCTH